MNKILKGYHEAMKWWHSLTSDEQEKESQKTQEEDRRLHPEDYRESEFD